MATTKPHIIPITDHVQRAEDPHIAVRAEKKRCGIEITVDMTTDAAAPAVLPGVHEHVTNESGAFVPSGACSDATDCAREYWVGDDNRVRLLAAGVPKPAEAVISFSNLDELTAMTSGWRMPQLVAVWNQLPGVRKVTRFTNRRIAVHRLWRTIEGLHVRHQRLNRRSETNKRVGLTKMQRIIALLASEGGATLRALMKATGWQAHSVRGFLSGKLSKQLGMTVHSFKSDGQRVYALGSAPARAEQCNDAAAESQAKT